MKEPAQAKQWRESRNLSVAQLAELSGYAPETLYLFERGQTPKGKPVAPWVWQRYKMVCAGIDAQLGSGKNFDWGK